MINDLPNKGSSSEADIEELMAQAERYGVKCVTVVDDSMLDSDLVKDIPVDWVRSNCVLPVMIDGEACVLTADIDKVSQQEYLSLLVSKELQPVLAPVSVIADSIERCYYSREDSPKEFLQEMDVERPDGIASDLKSNDLLAVEEKAPVTQYLNLILLEAVKRKASDIHFEPFESKLRVRYRIDGILYEQSSPPKNLEDTIVSRLKVMSHMDIAEKRLPQDGMARVRVGEREIDIRVSTIPVAEGERVVLRLLDKDSALLPLDVLGMTGAVLDSFQEVLKQSNGMIVVSGPTGSGKTTTLYAALGQLDSSRRNILTIEDPIEYQLADIGQIQVKPKIGLTFANGLRHILRQDPDVVLVGETRDVETAEIALRASLTGHLVFTTLHTNDAPGAILRLIDMGVEPHLLSSCMRGVLAQRLARKLCDECKMEADISKNELAELGEGSVKAVGKKAWKAVGCPSCLEGYVGRIGIFELMLVDRELQEIIRAGTVNADSLYEMAEKANMISLKTDAIAKIKEGVTTVEEVVAAIGGK